MIPLTAQLPGLSPQTIRDQQISAVIGRLDVASNDTLYEGLIVKTIRFDSLGRWVEQSTLHPFYDVVATANEYHRTYDEQGLLVRELKIYKTVGISEQGKEYIQLFVQ